MVSKKYIGSLSLNFIFLFSLIICISCISCSNGKKVSIAETTSTEPIKIELDLISDCLREFINVNADNSSLLDFELSLKTLKGERSQFKDRPEIWGLGKWVIDKVGSQEPVAQYSFDWGDECFILNVFLNKQNGVYKVRDWSSEKLLGVEWLGEIKE